MEIIYLLAALVAVILGFTIMAIGFFVWIIVLGKIFEWIERLLGLDR